MHLIDALVVSIGLDPAKFRSGRKEVESENRRLRESTTQTGRQIETDSKRAGDYIRNLKNETVGLLLVFAGAKGLGDFAMNILRNDAAVGRLATNIGMATEELSAWEGAVRRVGGQAGDADGALRLMASAFQSYQLTGTTGHDADFQGLGVTLKDLENPTTALLKMAEAGERLTKPEFVARLQRIGIPESTIILLEKGKRGVQALLEEQRKLGVVTDADSRAAQKMQDKWAQLQTAIEGKARPVISRLVDTLLQLANNTDAVAWAVPVMTGLLGAAGVAAAIAYWPFLALAGVLAMVAKGFDGSAESARKWGESRQFWEQLKNGDWAGAKDTFMKGVHEDLDPIFGGGTDVPPAGDTSGTPGGKGGSIVQSLMGYGLTREQARGVAAGIGAESKFNAQARNPTTGAYGIGQWLGSRQKALFRKYGNAPSPEQQLEFLVWELKGGDHGGKDVLKQTTADHALLSYIIKFMRPAAGRETISDIQRGRAYLRPVSQSRSSGASHETHIGKIDVHTQATDANGIAAALPGAIKRRGLTANANSGLTG